MHGTRGGRTGRADSDWSGLLFLLFLPLPLKHLAFLPWVIDTIDPYRIFSEMIEESRPQCDGHEQSSEPREQEPDSVVRANINNLMSIGTLSISADQDWDESEKCKIRNKRNDLIRTLLTSGNPNSSTTGLNASVICVDVFGLMMRIRTGDILPVVVVVTVSVAIATCGLVVDSTSGTV